MNSDSLLGIYRAPYEKPTPLSSVEPLYRLNDDGSVPGESHGHFQGNAWECRYHCLKAAGTHGNSVLTVRVFKNALWTALEPFSGQKYIILQDLAYTVSKVFQGDTLGPPRKRPRCLDLTQTPISAWLASELPTAPILRNDHWVRGVPGRV